MKLKGMEPRLAHEYGSGWRFSFHVEEESMGAAKHLVDNLKEGYLSAEVVRWKNQRSLDANAYAWVLIGKLSEHRKITKTEVYRNAIREIGGVSDIVCIQNHAVEKFVSGWERNNKSGGGGWFCETFPSKIEGCTNVIAYYGSSSYDTKQMSDLIDAIVQDCKAVGIETLPPNELERMNASWK